METAIEETGTACIIAEALASQGYRLIVTGRREEQLRHLAEQLPVACEVFLGDLCDPAVCASLSERLRATGDLRMVVHNAGYGHDASFLETRGGDGEQADLAARGIRLQVLCPGFTHTEFHDRLAWDAARRENRGLVRWMRADEVVRRSLRRLRGRSPWAYPVYVPGWSNRLLLACGFDTKEAVPVEDAYTGSLQIFCRL